ncbi:histidine kinase dimerization/phosphoacceptor domain -containing protein [Rhodoblastus sp.]|jgi:PAS domain S-box-containing protein|uniref:sensor histidine kinase n=1 Tax=Rhodoblastus sp. TaxID=1962975 RepID=UPI0025EBAAAB|nr:histidine kinase dimerization/phosphoacceptor domain -containing protein [Rhodoblastus sp.]
MTKDDADGIEALLDTADLSEALDNNRFKQFLDHAPVAVAVSELHPSEIVTYANLEFERLTGRSAAEIEGRSWRALPGISASADDDRLLGDAVRDDAEYIGEFTIERETGSVNVTAWSNMIEDAAGKPKFRLVALVGVAGQETCGGGRAKALQDNDILLRELQHRVKNNLQMITALIRSEARNVPDNATGERFDRLAGRINALAVLYDALTRENSNDNVDLGAYLGQIATAVMQAHAAEGVRLDMKLDTWPVSVDVAMPAGLVVNELLTNSLKHAFAGGEGGAIKLHSLIDDYGCHIVVADDGVGLPVGAIWPKPGKLGAIIVQSLRENACARVAVTSSPGKGVSVIISFAKAALSQSS